MKNQQSSIRFDHREIAVVFSLFIFVSLLMFTVGIMVGKGLQQAKFEGQHGPSRSIAHGEKVELGVTEDLHTGLTHPPTGTSITTGSSPSEHASLEASGLDKTPNLDAAHADPAPPEMAIEAHATPGKDSLEKSGPLTEMENSLDLVPAHPKQNKFGDLDEFPKTKESAKVLSDPKMAKFLEASPADRATASLSPGEVPKSFSQGKFTVQVGSYPNQREAVERVESLKKQGFPYAYYSTKEIDLKRGTWFRVWLGYFPDERTAKQGGELLLSRGEVNSYFVRKNENEG